ncbi:MAG: DUF2095 family protein [Desulfurococcales archaeon]|nr:DUF2095 family protein [Desulfurococcales archaeon]
MRISIDEFKKKFPHLSREILEEEGIQVVFERKPRDPWRRYLPGPIDYIRRSRSIEEALEVIDYLEKHGEITPEEAKKYREKLKNDGLKAFGPRKEGNYYYKKAMEYWRKMASARQQPQS